jgi:hypothetical protein
LCPLWLILLLRIAEVVLLEIFLRLPWWVLLWFFCHLDLIVTSLCCSAALLLACSLSSPDA